MKSLLFFSILFVTFITFSQQRKDNYIAADYYYGNIVKHNSGVGYLLRAHTTGVLLSYNERTHGEKRWHQEYNYPDWGVSFLYEDFHYEVLGRNYSVGVHYKFNFFDSKLKLLLGQGLNYNTNPFDIDDNPKNSAYGSHLTSSFQLGLQYVNARIIDNFGFQAGLLFFHHSNGGFKSPNVGTNVLSASLGLTYDFSEETISHKDVVEYEKVKEPVKYNFVVRGGINESNFVDLGQYPFVVFSAFIDKRFSYKHTLQAGLDFVISPFIKEHKRYIAAAFPSNEAYLDKDFKRASLFIGHEFRFNKLAIPTQLAYYFYNPSKYDNVPYLRGGVKYYFTPELFGVITVKAHGLNAEAIEYGVGVRL